VIDAAGAALDRPRTDLELARRADGLTFHRVERSRAPDAASDVFGPGALLEGCPGGGEPGEPGGSGAGNDELRHLVNTRLLEDPPLRHSSRRRSRRARSAGGLNGRAGAPV
jgi:hypothetical protein